MTHDLRVEAACKAFADYGTGNAGRWSEQPHVYAALSRARMTAALAAADAAAPQSQWRDIKDAPRDGSPIVIAWFYNSEWLFSTVRWDADFGIWEDDSGLEYEEFLLWAPVPLPSSPEGV